jgi:hypothetical protein
MRALFGLPGCNLLDRNHLGMRLPKAGAGESEATQSHTKAIIKPYTRHILGMSEAPQSHPKATPKPHQCDFKATPQPHQSHPYPRTMSAEWA